MIGFDVSNVRFVWDDSLVGRLCYFADSITDLINAVSSQEEDNMGVVMAFCSLDKPFTVFSHGSRRFAYPVEDAVSGRYNRAYVKFEWDDSLEHKKGLMSNTIDELILKVCKNATPEPILKNESKSHPFKDMEDGWNRFAYFDPYYDFRHALLKGEPVEFKWYGEWQPLKHCTFVLPPSHYRVKHEFTMYETSPADVHEGTRPAKRCSKHITTSEESEDVPSQESDNLPETYMELARWLSEGNGYCFDTVTGKVLTHFPFDLVAKDCRFNSSRYRLQSWGKEEPLTEM